MSYVLPLGPYHPSLEEPVHVKLYTEGELIKKAESYTDTAIISICRFSGEGWDRTAYIDPENKAICDSEVEMTKRAAGIFSN